MAFLTINGLKKSDFHTITLSTLDDLKDLEAELANLTFDLKESGEIGNSPDKGVTITFKFLDNELNFGYYNGRLLGDLTRAPIDAALFEKIGFSTDDEYYDPYNFFEYALEYEIEELESDDEDEEGDDEEVELPTKQCTKCHWEGPYYRAQINHYDKSGNLIPDGYSGSAF
jgi:hypothetical protein